MTAAGHTIEPAGDSALLIRFPPEISQARFEQVMDVLWPDEPTAVTAGQAVAAGASIGTVSGEFFFGLRDGDAA